MLMDRKTQYFKMSILSKEIYRLSAILLKIPMAFFLVEMEKLIFKLIWNGKSPLENQSNLKKLSWYTLNFEIQCKLW